MTYTRAKGKFYPQTIGSDNVGPWLVSTVRLPIDHGFGGPPKWYETMVFPRGSSRDLYCARYETEDEARAGHEHVVAELEKGSEPGVIE